MTEPTAPHRKGTTFQIWSEGYLATGMEGIPAKAHYWGIANGDSFAEACAEMFKDKEHAHYFDAGRLTYWGCRLFDTEADARRSFG